MREIAMKVKSILLWTVLFLTTLLPVFSQDNHPQVLMVVTSAKQMNNGKPTGVWLEEFAVPYMMFKAKGYDITVASPKGGKVPVDPRSIKDADKIFNWAPAIVQLDNVQKLSQIKTDNFSAIFIPGGHGAMFDLAEGTLLKRILGTFANENRIIAAVCHGPAALVNAKKSDGSFIVSNKQITAFTNAEEKAVKLDKDMPFMLETKLREEGAKFITAPNWSAHVQVDGKLVTGQNPASSEKTAAAVIKLLDQSK